MYNRVKAIDYAIKWWNKRNPNFYDFDSLGGDCTNFISQCLNYGDIPMNYSPNGWFYNNINSRAPAWTGVEEFYKFSTSNISNLGVKAKKCTIHEVEEGDIVQLKLRGEDRFHHSMIITKIKGEKNLSNILITCHTYNFVNRPLVTYNILDIRFLKILN